MQQERKVLDSCHICINSVVRKFKLGVAVSHEGKQVLNVVII